MSKSIPNNGNLSVPIRSAGSAWLVVALVSFVFCASVRADSEDYRVTLIEKVQLANGDHISVLTQVDTAGSSRQVQFPDSESDGYERAEDHPGQELDTVIESNDTLDERGRVTRYDDVESDHRELRAALVDLRSKTEAAQAEQAKASTTAWAIFVFGMVFFITTLGFRIRRKGRVGGKSTLNDHGDRKKESDDEALNGESDAGGFHDY